MTFDEYPLHDSIRGWFGRALYFEMQKNPNIVLITADLGYGLFDRHRDDLQDQFYNVGASEQAAVGAGIGLALSGKIPFVYSITTFLLFRAFEWHRNYINHENIPVRLIGSGMDYDYLHDGVTHQPSLHKEIVPLLDILPNINRYFPHDKEHVPLQVEAMVNYNQPAFMCLRR